MGESNSDMETAAFEEEVVKWIKERSGDNHYAIEAFMMACGQGYCKIVLYLISSGIDINQQDQQGRTGLHLCVLGGKLKCLKILVENGAWLDMKYQGMTPLQLASTKRIDEIVEYFISLPSCSRVRKIEALEILGASYIDFVDDRENALFYWSRSLEEREGAEPGDNVAPKRQEPHPAFQVKEFQTEEELNRMQFSFDQMSLQCLLIRERIFGPQHSLTVTHYIRRATAYADEGNTERSNRLMEYILDIQRKSDGVCEWTLHEYNSLIVKFSKVMFEGSSVKYKDVMAVFIKVIDVIEREMRPCLEPKNPWNSTTNQHDLYDVIRSVSILIELEPSGSENDRLKFRQGLYRLVNLNVREPNGFTLLHVACLSETTPNSPLDVVKLLLEVGADPQAVSLRGDTPLHCVATNEDITQHQMIKLLLSAGAHYDACNDDGLCFTNLLAGENEFMAGNPIDYCSLKCLSAKAVKRYGVPHETAVPTTILQFIKLH